MRIENPKFLNYYISLVGPSWSCTWLYNQSYHH